MLPESSDVPLELAWDTHLAVTHASGALPALATPPPGTSLSEALGLDDERARSLDARSREGETVEFLRVGTPREGRWLRVHLGRGAEGGWARVLDVGALLEGAPPVQISALSSSLSHELRNPLSSVKMAVQTVARIEGLSARDQRRLTIAEREIRTLERMLWMLSEYGREGPVAVESWNLPELVQQALELVDTDLQERKAIPRVTASPDLPRVRADHVRLRPVLAQLLMNVAAALPEGGELPIQLAPAPDGAQLELVDPVSRLAPGEETRIFEPFGSRLARGAGLSLAALRQVMRHQQGEVTAAPAPGGGPGITFQLRFARA